MSFGTRIKISGVIRKYDAHKTVLDGALRAAEELAKNGKNDVLKIKWNSSSSQIPLIHIFRPHILKMSPFYSVQLGGLRNLLNLIGENTGSKIFKNSETAKQWILDSYKTLTPNKIHQERGNKMKVQQTNPSFGAKWVDARKLLHSLPERP